MWLKIDKNKQLQTTGKLNSAYKQTVVIKLPKHETKKKAFKLNPLIIIKQEKKPYSNSIVNIDGIYFTVDEKIQQTYISKSIISHKKENWNAS